MFCNVRHYLLLLHNFDPGYRYKIMLQSKEREMMKSEIQFTLSCGDTDFKF